MQATNNGLLKEKNVVTHVNMDVTSKSDTSFLLSDIQGCKVERNKQKLGTCMILEDIESQIGVGLKKTLIWLIPYEH